MTPHLAFDDAARTAQAMVTATINGDRALVTRLAEGYPRPVLLALVFADLATALFAGSQVGETGEPPTDDALIAAWAETATEVELWRINTYGEETGA